MYTPQLEKRAFIFLLFLLMLGGILVLSPFLNTLVLSIAMTVMFYPLHKKFLKWTKKRMGLSATLSVFSVVLFIIIPFGILITLVTSQVYSVFNNVAVHISRPQFSDLLAHWHDKVTFYIARIEYLSGFDLNLVPTIENILHSLAGLVARYSPSVLSGTAEVMFHFFILVIVLFYLFRDGDSFFKQLIRISPVKDRYEIKLAHQIQKTIYGVFYGSFLTSLVQAILATVGYYLAGVEGALVWGVITFFMSFVPFVGTAIVIVPMVIYKILEAGWGYGVFLGIYGIVVIGLSDNLLKPFLIKSDMHPLVLFLSLFGGIAVFGAQGFLLGPILMALLTATLKIYDDDFAHSS